MKSLTIIAMTLILVAFGELAYTLTMLDTQLGGLIICGFITLMPVAGFTVGRCWHVFND